MTRARHSAIPKLRWAVVTVSIYFGVAWMLLADEHVYSGAALVVGLALAQGDEMPSWNVGDEFEAARLAALAAVDGS